MTRQNSLTLSDITRFRLYNQQISETKFKKPAEIVKWLGAVQGQDYSGAKWSIALRLPNVNDVEIEKAIADKKIIRTWPVRGTLHFVSADDIRWMLSLAASDPRSVKPPQPRPIYAFSPIRTFTSLFMVNR